MKFSPRLPLSRAPPLSRFLHEATFFARGQPVSARSENNGRERPRERYSNIQLPRKNASYFHVDAMESSRGPTVVSACGTRGSRLIRESLVGKSGGKSRGNGTPPCAYPVLNRDCGSPLTAPSPTERPTDVNWNRSIVWPCLSILLLLSFLSFFGEIHCADWKDRLRFFLMHILLFFLFSRSRNGNSIILEILYF